ncbi:hypothetical protein SUGI_0756450 [Cryptomeria japonica]|nr:hypothetical protein SUGI_0756450 [Cryptomeria japonica]
MWILAPQVLYDDETMKEVLHLIVDSFQDLDDFINVHYSRRIAILKIFAGIPISNLLIDLELHDLIYDMFHHFLVTTNGRHVKEIVATMKTIMVLCINESDVISYPQLSMLIFVLKNEWVVSSTGGELVQGVFSSCEGKLKPILKKEEQKIEDERFDLENKENTLPKDGSLSILQDVSIDVHASIQAENVSMKCRTNIGSVDSIDCKSDFTLLASDLEKSPSASNVLDSQLLVAKRKEEAHQYGNNSTVEKNSNFLMQHDNNSSSLSDRNWGRHLLALAEKEVQILSTVDGTHRYVENLIHNIPRGQNKVNISLADLQSIKDNMEEIKESFLHVIHDRDMATKVAGEATDLYNETQKKLKIFRRILQET